MQSFHQESCEILCPMHVRSFSTGVVFALTHSGDLVGDIKSPSRQGEVNITFDSLPLDRRSPALFHSAW